MLGGNLLCEIQNCGNAATAFGVKDTLKVRTCDHHIASLIAKGMTAYSNEGYAFISAPLDGLLFSERKALIEKGLGNLTVQETSLDAEYAAALALLQSSKETLIRTIEVGYSAIQEAVAKRHIEMKQQFAFLSENFNQFIQHRENSLLPAAELLCTEVQATALFIHLVIADTSDSVSQAISQCWSVSEVDIHSLLENAVAITMQSSKIETAKTYYQRGLKFDELEQWKAAEECYLQAKLLYEACASQSSDAARNLDDLGRVYRETERLSDAEDCHRQAQAIFERTEPQSAEAARNYCNFGWLCIKAKRLNEAEQYFQQAKYIYSVAEGRTLLQADNFKGLGEVRMQQARYSEAEEFFRQAQVLYDKSGSINAAYNHFRLGFVHYKLKQWKESEESLLQAKQVYESRNPQSVDCAICMYKLGQVYEAQNRNEESIASFRAAAELFTLQNDSRMKSSSEKSILRILTKKA